VVSYNEALRGFSEALGRDNEASQSILEDLAFLYRSKSDSSLAEDAFRQRYKARERLFGIAHRSTLEAAIDLGREMIVLHKFDDATTVLRTTLEAFEYQDGLDCQEKFEALSCLGDILKEQNNAEDACALYYRALAGFERTVGSESNLTVKTKYSLAAALVHTSHYVKAVETLKDVVEKTEGTFGIGHQDWMRATRSLGHTYIKMGKMKEAEVTLNRCLEQSLNSPLRNESVVKDAALDLKAVYSSLGDTSAVCIMEAWIKGGNVELPLSQKSPTNVAVHKTPDNPETLSIPAVVSDVNGDTEVSENVPKRLLMDPHNLWFGSLIE
jgi:tetratricopeptide (TPR) repeat protein